MAIGPQVFPSIPATRNSRLNITAATVVKAAPGFVGTVTVVVAGSAHGAIGDALTTGAVSAANTIAYLPTTAGTYVINFPAHVGIAVVPGTGQTLSVSFA
jgi:hypothetical protein